MDSARKTPPQDQTAPPSSWDPKRFICDHNADRPDLAEKIALNAKKQEDLEKKLDRNEEKLNDLQHFYEEYGEKHPENIVTLKMYEYRCSKWEHQSYLEEELGQVEDELSQNRMFLKLVEKNAQEVNCPCLKKEH